MCGIFGVVASESVGKKDLNVLVEHARQRGRDSSGLIYHDRNKFNIYRADYDIRRLLGKVRLKGSSVVLGHSRLITNGLADNQPVVRGDVSVIHNGIIVNDEKLWSELNFKRHQEIDSEVIAAIAESHVNETGNLSGLAEKVLSVCKGVVATAILAPKLGQLIVFSNNGSLYVGHKGKDFFFSSEEYPL